MGLASNSWPNQAIRCPYGDATLVQVARTACVADKKSLREMAADNWTRIIHIDVPVRDPGACEGRAAALACELLQALTCGCRKLCQCATRRCLTARG
jgi:hypothetical protein